MKNILKCLIILLILTCINTNALTIYTNNIEVKPGDTTIVDIYGNYLDNNGFEIITNGNVTANYTSVLTCLSGEGSTCTLGLTAADGLVKIGELSLTIPSETEGRIAKVYLGGNVINISINRNATTDIPNQESEASEVEKDPTTPEETQVEKKYPNLLKTIKSKYVSIDLEEGIYEYTIEIDEDLTKLDLNPIPNDESTNVEISSQVLEEIEDNKITIKLTNGTDTEEYVINIKIKNSTAKKITIAPTPEKEYPIIGICVIVGASLCVLTYLGRLHKGMKRRKRRGRN